MRTLFATFALCTLPALAVAHDFTIGSLKVEHPYAFETAPAMSTGGGYLSITNTGATDDTLIEVRADFPKVQLHQSVEKDGVATMTHVERLAIPAGATVALAPGGYHVMFMGLKGHPLEAGQSFDATLVFEKAGELAISFKIEPRNGDQKAHASHN